MGDMREVFDAMKEHTKETKAGRMKDNIDIINASGLDYTPHNKGYQLNFKLDGLPTITFYPSTNKWVVLGKTCFGNAESLLQFIEKGRKGE